VTTGLDGAPGLGDLACVTGSTDNVKPQLEVAKGMPDYVSSLLGQARAVGKCAFAVR